MTDASLLSRAKDFLQQRAGITALVILPLATAATSRADSVFVLGFDSPPSVSGGAVGHANSSLTNSDHTVHMAGDTITRTSPLTYLKTESAVFSDGGSISDGSNTTANIIFQWGGTFGSSSTVTPADYLLVTPNISWNVSPNDGNSTVSWSLEAIILNQYSDPLVDVTTTSADSGTALQPINSDDTPDTWLVTLTYKWTFPSTTDHFGNTTPTFPNDQLNATPAIDMTIQSPSGGATPLPLPAAFWPGILLLGGMVGARRIRRLRSNKRSDH